MPNASPFVNTEPLFARVEELRQSFRGLESVEGLNPVSVSNTGATETLTTVVGLAGALPASIGAQLELIARSIALGGLRPLAADRVETED